MLNRQSLSLLALNRPFMGLEKCFGLHLLDPWSFCVRYVDCFRKQIKSAELGTNSPSQQCQQTKTYVKMIHNDFSRVPFVSFKPGLKSAARRVPWQVHDGLAAPMMLSQTGVIPFIEEGLLRICGNILAIFILYIL